MMALCSSEDDGGKKFAHFEAFTSTQIFWCWMSSAKRIASSKRAACFWPAKAGCPAGKRPSQKGIHMGLVVTPYSRSFEHGRQVSATSFLSWFLTGFMSVTQKRTCTEEFSMTDSPDDKFKVTSSDGKDATTCSLASTALLEPAIATVQYTLSLPLCDPGIFKFRGACTLISKMDCSLPASFEPRLTPDVELSLCTLDRVSPRLGL
mmetsp:Transcript_29873/g.69493  ORF Transcript_29873/g.69493 Transcript_29873/m.69493 type:complete len:206 (+) Transcript_29873:2902-3519(+)